MDQQAQHQMFLNQLLPDQEKHDKAQNLSDLRNSIQELLQATSVINTFLICMGMILAFTW